MSLPKYLELVIVLVELGLIALWYYKGGRREYRFTDYSVRTGRLTDQHNQAPGYWATLDEFAGLVATGATVEEATAGLKVEFEQRIATLKASGAAMPPPGSPRAYTTFAPSDRVEAFHPLVAEFWEVILNTDYATSFVSNESTLDAWEHYVRGGREEIIRRVKSHFGVDITEHYEAAIPDIMAAIEEHRQQKY
jgi:predicted RNase H-like HicB family nuclease